MQELDGDEEVWKEDGSSGGSSVNVAGPSSLGVSINVPTRLSFLRINF